MLTNRVSIQVDLKKKKTIRSEKDSLPLNIRGHAEPFSRGSGTPLSEFDLNGGNRKNKGRHPLTLSRA